MTSHQKPYKKPRKPGDMGYHRGALVALGVVYAWDGVGVAYHEVVSGFDLDELLHVARREGQMKWSGLSEYVRKAASHKKWTTPEERECK